MSATEYNTLRLTPLAHVGDLPARQLLQFLATCSPRTRAHLLATLTK
jgi:hypothetical protein